MKTKHKIDFEKARIIDKENSKYKRLFSEMMHIHINKNNINRMTDTNKLKNIYKSFLDQLSLYNSNEFSNAF